MSAVFSCVPVNSTARFKISSLIIRVVLMHISMHEPSANVKSLRGETPANQGFLAREKLTGNRSAPFAK